jgi:hypothetical protein
LNLSRGCLAVGLVLVPLLEVGIGVEFSEAEMEQLATKEPFKRYGDIRPAFLLMLANPVFARGLAIMRARCAQYGQQSQAQEKVMHFHSISNGSNIRLSGEFA